MKTVLTISRYALGLAFILFGLNGFFHFIPVPPFEGDAATFLGLLGNSGYLSVVKILEIAGGLMLVLGRFVPLGLTLLGPVLVNIILFHVFFAPADYLLPLVLTVFWFLTFGAHRPAFDDILGTSS